MAPGPLACGPGRQSCLPTARGPGSPLPPGVEAGTAPPATRPTTRPVRRPGGQPAAAAAPLHQLRSRPPRSLRPRRLALPTLPRRRRLSCPGAELSRSRLAGALTPACPRPHPPGGGACGEDGQTAAPPAQPGPWAASAPSPHATPTRTVTVVPKHPVLPPRVPPGDSCQVPQPTRASALTADPTPLKDQRPRVPKPPCGTAEGRGEGHKDRALVPSPSWALTSCQRPPHLPGTIFMGAAAGALGRQGVGAGCGEGHRPLGGGGGSEPEQWQRRCRGGGHGCPLSAAVPVSVGEGGGQGARGI